MVNYFANIFWFLLHKCKDLLLVFVWRCHFGLWQIVMSILFTIYWHFWRTNLESTGQVNRYIKFSPISNLYLVLLLHIHSYVLDPISRYMMIPVITYEPIDSEVFPSPDSVNVSFLLTFTALNPHFNAHDFAAGQKKGDWKDSSSVWAWHLRYGLLKLNPGGRKGRRQWLSE